MEGLDQSHENMTNPSILNTLNDLGSGKTRERNNALDELTSILKQSPDLIPTKALGSTCETLIEVLDSEYRKYCLLANKNDVSSGKLSLSENRLSQVAYVLRLFIEKSCSRFKVKTMRLLLAVLPELMVIEGSKTLLEPISVHLTFALHALIRSRLFQLKMVLHQWVSLVDIVCSYLAERFKVSHTDRDVSNLISILNTLLTMDCIGLSQVRQTIYSTLLEYLRRSQKQNANTRLILCMVNEFVLKTHCLNILDALYLIKQTWKHVIAINISTNEALQNELSYLDTFASELIVHNIPTMIGNEEALSECTGASLYNICREYLISRLSGYKASWLSVDLLKFSTDSGVKISFFELDDFQLKETADIQPWLRIMSITRLLISYFKLLQRDSTESNLFKKHKCESSFSSLLRDSQSINSFLLNGLQAPDTDLQLVSLQMAAFTAALQDINGNDIRELQSSIEQKFDNVQFIEWACLALIPLFSQQDSSQTEKSCSRIFRLCLPLIKQHELCPVVCSLLSTVIKYSHHKTLPDKATLSQIASIYELSDVNGPGLPCDEAFLFWQHLQYYGKQIDDLPLEYTSHKIVEWMESKWGQIMPLEGNQGKFYEFVAWLCNRRRFGPAETGSDSYRTFDWQGRWQDRYLLWKDQEEERLFILQVEPERRTIVKCPNAMTFDNIATDRVRLNSILYRLLELIEGDNELTSIKRCQWIFQVTNLAGHLSGDSGYLNYLLDFKRATSTALQDIALPDTKSYATFFKSILCLKAPTAMHLVLDKLPIDKIMKDFKEMLFQIQDRGRQLNSSEFSTLFDRDILTSHIEVNDTNTSALLKPLPSLSLEAYLVVLRYKADKSCKNTMQYILEFLNGLKSDDFLMCLDPVISWILEQNESFGYDNDQLQPFIETLSEYLLQSDYNTSSAAAYYLCSFLDSVRAVWLQNSTSPLNADCNDIFDWIIARFEDRSVSGRRAVKRLSQLLLHMLKTQDLSRGYLKGGKQRVFAAYSKSLRALDVTDVVTELPDIVNYMTKVSIKNQQIVFSEICALVDTPQQSLEMSALYSLTMSKLSLASYLNMSLGIRDAMQYTQFSHTRVYIASALKKMASSAGLSGTTQLFEVFKFDVLSLWFDRSNTGGETAYSLWDFDIFGFPNLSHFIQAHIPELSALYFSKEKKPDILGQLKASTGQTEKQLLLKYYYLVVPLSFIPGGKGENIYSSFRDLTGSHLSKVENRPLLYKWILRFIDLGSNYETSTMINKISAVSNGTEILYFPHANLVRYQYPLHISLKTGLVLLRRLLEKELFCKDEIYFILLTILTDLERASYVSDKLKCLRELKLTLALSDEKLNTCDFLPTLLPPLSKYLTIIELHNETADIITFILTVCREQIFAIVEEAIPLFCNLLVFKRKFNTDVSSSLKEALELFAATSNFSQRTFGYCSDAIQGNVLSLDVYKDVELLEFEEFEEFSIERVILLSLLFGYAQRPSHSLCIEKPSLRSASNLVKHDIPAELVTRNFQLWSAYYLKAFNSIHDLKTLYSNRVSTSKDSFDRLFIDFGSPDHLYEEFLVIANTPSNLDCSTVRLFCTSLITLFLSNDSYSEERTFLTKRQLFKRCKNHCLSISDMEFWSLNKEEKLAPDMATFFSQYYLSRDLSYSEWLIGLDTALLYHLTASFPKLKLFHPLCKISTIFARNILPILFNLVVCFDARTAVEWTKVMFSKIEVLVNCLDSNRKVNSVLGVMNMLMWGKRLKEPHSLDCCSVLPLKSIYHAALESGQVTSAYMIFEMLYMTDQSDLDGETLSVIYESLGDVDLLAGLPAPHTMTDALHSATKIEPKAKKTFLLNNAMADAQSLNNKTSEITDLLKTSENQGLYGIASCLSKTHLSSKDDVGEYRWALQLGKWDLPIPKVINAKDKGLYSTLRRVSSGFSHPSRILEDAMTDIIESRPAFKEKTEWAETIAEVSLLKEMAEEYKSPEYMTGFLQRCFDLDEKTLRADDFDDYKSNTQTRFLLSQLLVAKNSMSQSSPSSGLTMCSAALLANNVKLAIQEKCSQDAIRNAIIFDQLSKQEVESSILRRARLYISARALWESGDNKTPVTILKGLLHQEDSASDNEPTNSLLAVSNDEIRALLVKWTSESRLETPSTIFERYIKDFETTVKDHGARADTFYILANFLNAQFKRLKDSGELEERQKRCENGTKESRALDAINKKANLSSNERKDARRHYNRVLLQLNSDREILNALLVQRVQFVWRSLHYFINTLVFTSKYDGDVLDKFCGLWFEHDGDETINSLLKKEIGMIPSWKFLPWVNQIASKLSIEDTEFQKPLQLTMKRLLYKLPYDSLYSVLSMKLYESHSFTSDSIIPQKIKAVDRILTELKGYDSGSYYNTYVLPVKEFCEQSVELANHQLTVNLKSTRKLHLKSLKTGSYWLTRLPGHQLPLPTLKWPINTSSDGKAPRPYISHVDEMIDISVTGLSLPKIVTFTISDGSRHKVLMKGSNDDLRQDAIMEQVFQQVNSILQREKQMRKRNLIINTYTVIPLGPRAGIIEFVTNSLSLHQILTSLHKNDTVSFNDARNEMKKVQTKSNNERLQTYLKLTQEIKPQLRNFFFNSFPDPDQWFNAKKTYTKGIATTSIVGYILGLGDRHLNNILLDHHTGEPTHIDLGIAFDQGRLLPIPEMIPFRLTRDIVDGFGVTGVEGLFRRSCEHTYAVLRDNYEKVMHVLNILKWDPLYSWVMSPVKKHKHLLDGESQDYSSMSFGDDSDDLKPKVKEQNQESYRALKSAEEKLIGNGLSVEATVQELIQQASDPQKLSLVYMGWSPFY